MIVKFAVRRDGEILLTGHMNTVNLDAPTERALAQIRRYHTAYEFSHLKDVERVVCQLGRGATSLSSTTLLEFEEHVLLQIFKFKVFFMEEEHPLCVEVRGRDRDTALLVTGEQIARFASDNNQIRKVIDA